MHDLKSLFCLFICSRCCIETNLYYLSSDEVKSFQLIETQNKHQMADRDGPHPQRPIYYATILPSDSTTINTSQHESPSSRKQTELERAKAVR